VARAVVSSNVVDFGLQQFDGTEKKSIFELAFHCVSWVFSHLFFIEKGRELKAFWVEKRLSLGKVFFFQLAQWKALSPRPLV